MSVRSWAVGVVSTAAVVTGMVAVQSGITGTAALPILPHRTVAPAVPADGAELPAPAEVGAPPPGAGTVHEVPVARAAVGPERSAADRSANRVTRADGKAEKDDRPAKSSGKDSGKDSDQDSGRESGGDSGHGSGEDSGGGPDQN
jgi:hypothetical protein